jgi:hypothetical protein
MRQTFDHNTPSAPALTLGMLLGASGVTHPPIQRIGNLLATGSANGQFSDAFGLGELCAYIVGTQRYLLVADYSNNRYQFFEEQSDGSWDWLHTVSTATLGVANSSVASCIAVDYARSEIHFGGNQGVTVGVWSFVDFPSFTAANRLRTYSGGVSPKRIHVRGDFTYMGAGTTRVKVNHVTDTIVTTLTQTGQALTPTPNDDGTLLWTSNQQTTGTIRGLHRIDTTTLLSTGKVDQNASGAHRPETGGYNDVDNTSAIFYGGRLYVGTHRGPLVAWDSDDVYLGEFAWPGGARIDETYGHWTGAMNQNGISSDAPRFNFIPAADGSQSALVVYWCSNASQSDNRVSGNQSYLTLVPISTATATWTKTDFSTGTNTIKAISLKGTNLSGEKFKIRLKKNAGAWTTITPDLVQDEAALDFETFTAGDTLTVELSLSTWDRLDGHATLFATRDKLSPSEVAVQLVYEDTDGDVYVPYATAGFKARQNATGAFKARQGE